MFLAVQVNILGLSFFSDVKIINFNINLDIDEINPTDETHQIDEIHHVDEILCIEKVQYPGSALESTGLGTPPPSKSCK